MIHDLNQEVFLFLNFDGGIFLDKLMFFISSPWMFIFIVPLFFIANIIKIFKEESGKERWIYSILMVLCMGLIVLFADSTANFFKDNFSRFRPSHEPVLKGLIHIVNDYWGGLYGTVSGHAANSFGILVFFSLCFSNKYFSCAAVMLALVISYSRIYLGVHYPLDLIYGSFFGILYAYLFYYLFAKARTLIRRKIHLTDNR